MTIQLSICAPVGSSASDSPLSSSEKADSILLNSCAIHAVNDLKPYPEGSKLEPFMYWDADVNGTSAALALIKRYVVVTMSFVILVFLH
jgi:hypothetical protein